MSDNSLWLVPVDQESSVARIWEIAEQLWERGIIPMFSLAEIGCEDEFIEQSIPYDYFHRRLAEWKASGRSLPKVQQGDFGSVWITCRPYKFLVPETADQFCDLRCPLCHDLVAPSVDSPAGGAFGRTIGAILWCRNCENTFPATLIEFDPSQVTWTRFSISFHEMANCETFGDEPWLCDAMVIIGPCRQFHGWET